MKRKAISSVFWKKLLAGMLSLTLLLLSCPLAMLPFAAQADAATAPPFDVSAEAVYMVNLDTGDVIYEKNAHKQLAPASLTKLMTVILTMELVDDYDNTIVTAPSYVYNELYEIGKGQISTADIRQGEEMSVRKLLYCMMLQSANEGAAIIADYLGDGSIPQFVEMMNERAKELGCQNTNFVNPHGLDADGHVSSAYDMYLIAKHAISLDGFMDIATTLSIDISPTNIHTSDYWLSSTNSMMKSTSEYYYAPVRGIKTGTTDNAGRCFVSTATLDGFTYLLVVMGSQYQDGDGNYLTENNAFIDTKNLYEWAFDTFRVKTVVEPGKNVCEIPVKYVWGKDYLVLMSGDRFTTLMDKDIEVSNVVLEPVIPAYLEAPVNKGDQVGEMRLLLAGEELGRVPLIAAESVERNQWLYTWSKVTGVFQSFWFKFILIFLVTFILLYILLVVIRNHNRQKYSKVRRRRRL